MFTIPIKPLIFIRQTDATNRYPLTTIYKFKSTILITLAKVKRCLILMYFTQKFAREMLRNVQV